MNYCYSPVTASDDAYTCERAPGHGGKHEAVIEGWVGGRAVEVTIAWRDA